MKTPLLVNGACLRLPRWDRRVPRTRELTGGWRPGWGTHQDCFCSLEPTWLLSPCWEDAAGWGTPGLTRVGPVYRSWGLKHIPRLANEMEMVSGKVNLLLWPHRAWEVGLALITLQEPKDSPGLCSLWPPAVSSQWREGKEVLASSSSSCPCFVKEHIPLSAGHRLDIPARNLLWFPFLGKSNECSGHLGPSPLIWRSPWTPAWVSSFSLIVDWPVCHPNAQSNREEKCCHPAQDSSFLDFPFISLSLSLTYLSESLHISKTHIKPARAAATCRRTKK